MTKNGDHNEKNVPLLEKLKRGDHVPGDFDVPICRPEWFNATMFALGQQFLKKNLICVFFSDLVSLLIVLSFPKVNRLLIYTGKSGDPLTALKRYVSTVRVVLTWYEGDIWTKGDRGNSSMTYVRNSHKHIALKASKPSNHEVINVIRVPEKTSSSSKTRNFELVRTDLKTYQKLYDNNDTNVYVSQWDLIFVQYAFFGAIVAHPRRFGIFNAAREELEGFIHFWRVIGYLMGIKDEFNICSGNLEQTEDIIHLLETQVILPNFSMIDENFEHMADALMTGMNKMVPLINYPCTLCYIIETINGNTGKLYSAMTKRHKWIYSVIRILIDCFRINWFKRMCGGLLRIGLDLIEGRGPRWWPRIFSPATRISPSLYR